MQKYFTVGIILHSQWQYMRVPIATHSSHKRYHQSFYISKPVDIQCWFPSLWFKVEVMPITKVLPLSWFPMCCLKLQRMRETCSCHTSNLDKHQGQIHLHPSGTWSVSCFTTTWELKKGNSWAHSLGLIKKYSGASGLYSYRRSSDDPVAQSIWKPLVQGF